MSEMNKSTGVAILLDRMKTNPEEFYGDGFKWGFVFSGHFEKALTDDEKEALKEAHKIVKRKEFDEAVMRRLVEEPTTAEPQLENAISHHLKNFGRAQPKGEGMAVSYDHNTDTYRYKAVGRYDSGVLNPLNSAQQQDSHNPNLLK
jgi:hypothetical protein